MNPFWILLAVVLILCGWALAVVTGHNILQPAVDVFGQAMSGQASVTP